MPDIYIEEMMPVIFKNRPFRGLLAALLGASLYCAILVESSFCMLFFYCELELILKFSVFFQQRYIEQPQQLRCYLLEYGVLLLSSFLLMTLVFILPVLLSLKIFNTLSFNDYLLWQLRQSYVLVGIVVSLLFLIKTAYFNYLRLKQMEVETERLRKESVQQQFENLKNYVNPAFLFGSLDTLIKLVPHDKEQAAQYVHQLSGVYRYILENKDKELVTLGREAGFMEAYAFLLAIQYGTALNLTWKIEPESHDWCLPPLTLQFIVENLMQHFHPNPENALHLSITGADEQLLIRYRMQQSVTTPVPFRNSLIKIMQKYEYLTDRKITARQQGPEVLVSIPLLRVSYAPRTATPTAP